MKKHACSFVIYLFLTVFCAEAQTFSKWQITSFRGGRADDQFSTTIDSLTFATESSNLSLQVAYKDADHLLQYYSFLLYGEKYYITDWNNDTVENASPRRIKGALHSADYIKGGGSMWSFHNNIISYQYSSEKNDSSVWYENKKATIQTDGIGFNFISAKEITRQSDTINDYFYHTQVDVFNLIGSKKAFVITDSATKLNMVNVVSDSIEDVKFFFLNSSVLALSNCRVSKDGIQFTTGFLPDTIFICNTKFLSPEAKIDLSNLIPRVPGKKCLICIRNSNVSNIEFNYRDFRLHWETWDSSKDEKSKMYTQLLEKYKKEGKDESYKLLDIEYKQFKYLKDSSKIDMVLNKLDCWWWNYGYDKQKIVKNSLTVFGCTIVGNLLLFGLLFSLYKPDNFKLLDESLKKKYKRDSIRKSPYYFVRIPAVIAYTAYIFWGIKLEFDKMTFEKWWWPLAFIVLMIEYLIGIVCLAYIANLIITK